MQRYECALDCLGGVMQEDPDGEYVRYADVAALIGSVERATPATQVLEWIRTGKFTDAELEALRAEICVTLPT